MNQIVLKEEYLDKIKTDEGLKKKVADVLGVSIKSMPRILYGNDKKLTQAIVLKVLREHCGVKQDKNLLVEIQISAVA